MTDRTGDRVQAALFRNGADLLAYLERRVAVREDAADLLAETMTTAWRRADSVPADEERARMWLFVTARNTLANHQRSARRSADLASRLRSVLAVTRPHAEDPSEHAHVRDAVERLPERSRELVRLVHWDGFSIVEAARLLGIRPSTARTRHAVAMATLRDTLGDEDPRSRQPGVTNREFQTARTADS